MTTLPSEVELGFELRDRVLKTLKADEELWKNIMSLRTYDRGIMMNLSPNGMMDFRIITFDKWNELYPPVGNTGGYAMTTGMEELCESRIKKIVEKEVGKAFRIALERVKAEMGENGECMFFAMFGANIIGEEKAE